MHNLCTDRTSPFVRHDPHLQIHPPRAAPAIELSGISLRGHAPLAYPVEIPKHVEDCLIVCIKCPMWLQEACEPIRSTLCSCSWSHGRGLQSACRCRSSHARSSGCRSASVPSLITKSRILFAISPNETNLTQSHIHMTEVHTWLWPATYIFQSRSMLARHHPSHTGECLPANTADVQCLVYVRGYGVRRLTKRAIS